MPSRTLTTLVRVAKHKVEQVQQRLAVATADLRKLEAQRTDWLARRRAAEHTPTTDVHAIADAVSFAKRVQQQVAKLDAHIADQMQVVETIRQQLQIEYAARERYTQLVEKQQVAENHARAVKVQNALDDRAGGRANATASAASAAPKEETPTPPASAATGWPSGTAR